MLLRRGLHRTSWAPVLILLFTILLVCLYGSIPAFGQGESAEAQPYIVFGVRSESQRVEVSGTGAAIDAVGRAWVQIRATPEQVIAIQALGYRVEPTVSGAEVGAFEVYLPFVLSSGEASGEKEEFDYAPQYIVYGVYDKYQRADIARTGAAIDAAGDDWIEISAIPAEIAAIEALGYQVWPLTPPAHVLEFPPEDSDYHDYAEMVAEIGQAAAEHSNVVSLFSLGQSYEGRDLWAVKVSDNPGLDESEPEVLFQVHQHANEHLTVEQGLYLLRILTDEYDVTPQITNLVNSREIYILFDVNPDGGEHDHATGSYSNWRKNRQPNEGSVEVGTDPNRNWSYQWGCCGGSSANPSSRTYRGPYPFSAPETDAVRSFVESRVIEGEQQITAFVDIHSYGEIVLWPYGYTLEDIPPDMTADDHNVFVTIGQNMASLSDYQAAQSGYWYVVDGTSIDWMYGVHQIFAFVYELYPLSANQGGFYPPDEVIPAETSRNREAFLYFIELADCPYRAIGKQAEYCSVGPAEPTPTPEPAPGLQAYWKLDEVSGYRLDSSGQNNFLTDNNTVGSTLGQMGLAADFESDRWEWLSISDGAQIGLDITGSLTLAGWMKPERVDQWQVMAGKYEWDVSNRGYRLDLRPESAIGFIVSPDGSFGSEYVLEVYPTSGLSPGTWYHVAGVFDAEAKTLSVYLDGELLASRAVTYDHVYDSWAPFMLGANMQNGQATQFFDGRLDEWRVYSRALSEGEIENLMLPSSPTPTPTPTPTPLPVATLLATATNTPDPAMTSTPTPTNTPWPTATTTPTPSVTPTATETPLPTATGTPTPSPTFTPTPTPVPADLQGYWMLDEASGQRLDSSERGNHLADHNTVGSQAGQVGLAADLESDNLEWLSIDEAAQSGLDITGSLTLAGWMMPEQVERWQVLAGKCEAGVNNCGYRLDLRPGNVIGLVVSADGGEGSEYLLEATPSFSLSPGTWYHVAGVFDAAAGTLSVYLDGALIASRPVSYGSVYHSTAPFMLGANLADGQVTQYFDGRLDGWQVYSRALSEIEIEALMVLPPPTPTSTPTPTPTPTQTPLPVSTLVPTATQAPSNP